MSNKKQKICESDVQKFSINIGKKSPFSEKWKIITDPSHPSVNDEVDKKWRPEIKGMQKPKLDRNNPREHDELFRALICRKDLKKILGVSYVTIYNWTVRGILIPQKIGGKVYFSRSSIIELLNGNNNLTTNKYENK